MKRYVSLAPLWHGTQVAEPATNFAPVFGADDESTPVCVACGQFNSGSRFMRRCVRAVLPSTGSRAADPVAAAVVLNALDPAHKRPVPCTVVAPFVGSAPTS